jgi:hypothetical protein
MLIATYTEAGGTKIHNKVSGKSRWLIKTQFNATMKDGQEIVEKDTLRVKTPCSLADVLPTASDAIRNMLTDIEQDVIKCAGKFEVWKI